MGNVDRDQRPAADQIEPTQELDGLRYQLQLRLESGARGEVRILWKEDGEILVRVRGAAVRQEDRIREGRR